jgi:hypothetical protein
MDAGCIPNHLGRAERSEPVLAGQRYGMRRSRTS